MGRDHYKTLGVERNASADEIKRAYRRLTKQYHPDRNPNDPSAERKFKEVQQAYEVIGDKDKRAEYDQFGEAGVGHWDTDPRGQRVYTWGGTQIPVDDLQDLFGAFGGGASVFDDILGRGGGRSRVRRRGRPEPEPGQDLERTVNLSFDQAVNGTTIEIDIPGDGSGRRGRQTLDVHIRPGVDDGQRIRIKGRGGPGAHGGPPGDLFLVCSVRPHSCFRREGLDLHLEVPVSIPEAALGAKVEVPTLAGPVTLTLPPGTGSGAKLRLAGKGIRDANGSTGDQIVIIRIVPPKTLTEEQRRLFEQLAETMRENPRKGLKW
jgi:DnaJ-class molecular chaperone